MLGVGMSLGAGGGSAAGIGRGGSATAMAATAATTTTTFTTTAGTGMGQQHHHPHPHQHPSIQIQVGGGGVGVDGLSSTSSSYAVHHAALYSTHHQVVECVRTSSCVCVSVIVGACPCHMRIHNPYASACYSCILTFSFCVSSMSHLRTTHYPPIIQSANQSEKPKKFVKHTRLDFEFICFCGHLVHC